MMGHKDPEAMAAQEGKLIEGSAKYGMKAEDAKKLFTFMTDGRASPEYP